jgi:hypothetical protein
MVRYLCCAVIFGGLFLSSCGGFPTDAPVAGPGANATSTPLGESVKTAVTTDLPDSGVEATALPDLTLTPTSTAETGLPTPITNMPTLTPTKELDLVPKPSATSYPISIQFGAPIYTNNFAYPDLGCNWFGVAGQVFDIDGVPVKNLVIEAGGNLGPAVIFNLSISGSVQQYGPGGYEIKLGDQPLDSQNTVWIQVRDLDGQALSGPTYFKTFDDCQKNLILINFSEAAPATFMEFYLPMVFGRPSN